MVSIYDQEWLVGGLGYNHLSQPKVWCHIDKKDPFWNFKQVKQIKYTWTYLIIC